MNFSKILLESREDDFRSKYTHKFGSQNVERLINTIMPKYLDWVGKHMDPVNFDEVFGKVVSSIKTFDKVSNNLPITDINQFKDLSQFFNVITEYGNKARREVEEHPGGNLVYNDDRFYVVNPLTHEASCYYGKGTKWCTSAAGDFHFKKYNNEGKLFYVIDKRLQTSDPFYKVAILKNFDGGESFWDARDIQFTDGWILKTDEYKIIQENITNYMNSEYAEQIKIFTDKELAKKERERLERLRIAQIQREREEESQERRENDEWELNDSCPDEGLKAHALLDWLVDTSDISVLTNEDRIEIQRLESEIERLNNEYNNDEDTRIDLLDEIEDLEDELNSLKEKIDVYNIIPTGEHYELTTFEVINGGLDGREYAVGDETEMKDSCYEYVDQLVDEIGYRGFAKGFADNYIDEDKVEDWARDFYENDVYDSPESYFDESQRELSRKQIERIRILENKIEEIRKNIEFLENYLESIEDDEEVETTQEKIDELNDLITECEEEIENENDSPDGDFPQNLIDDVVEERVEDALRDPIEFLRNWDLELDDFINRRDFIEGVIDADGYGNTISSYDGNADDVIINKETYWVIRLN